MKGLFFYPRVVRFWAVIFLIVGLLFLFLPYSVVHFLTALGHWLGFSGSITGAPATLWYVLALSLMSIITVNAWFSAKHPSHRETYYALLTAKWVSTIAFVWLATFKGGVWLVAAMGDGFVALTLWWSHAVTYQKSFALLPAFARAFKGQSPFHEEWFTEIKTGPNQAFWFRYTILNGTKARASTWALMFDGEEVRAFKDSEELSDLAPGNCVILPHDQDLARFRALPQVFHSGASHLDAQHAIGKAGPISWDLSFKDLGKRFCHVPKILQILGLAKSTLESCFLDLRFSGVIRYGDQEIQVNEAPGLIGHIYGKKHAHEWTWAHCNSFENTEAVVFEGISARVKLGTWISPPISSFVLYVGERCYAFSSVWKLFSANSEFGKGRWKFSTTHRGVTIEGEALAPSEDKVALVHYTDTDGSSLWCRNSKLADLRIRLIDPKEDLDLSLVAKGSVAFEIVNRERPQGEVDL